MFSPRRSPEQCLFLMVGKNRKRCASQGNQEEGRLGAGYTEGTIIEKGKKVVDQLPKPPVDPWVHQEGDEDEDS